ncbi:MAG: S41 family peptidase [Candidatus Firestonebacteria bacterium]
MKKLILSMVMLLVLGGSNLYSIDSDKEVREIIDSEYKKLQQVLESLDYINKFYVDEDKIKGDSLLYGAIKGMISTLDPFSHFMDPEEYKESQSEIGGIYGGIGTEITIRKDVLTVVAPFEKSPAWYKGVRAGDRILKIDGVSTKNITTNEAVKKIRGPKGTKVVLTILHEGEEKSEDIEIIRDNIKIQSVWSYIIEDGIGYIRLRSFSENSGRDIEKVLVDFEKNKVKSIIFDLRNNPGGLLDVSVDISDRFLTVDKLIVYTQGRTTNKGASRKFYSRTGNIYCESIPLILLVNKGSASASEIVTGAIQDNKRGLIIGTQTFGKASVQSVYTLGDGSGMRLTTAYYYTPSGKKIHEKGITPDIIIEETSPSDVVWKLKYYEHFINFAKKYIKESPVKENQDINVENLVVDDKIVDEFIKEVRSKGFSISDSDIEQNKGFIKKSIKIEIVRASKGEEAGEKVAIGEDEIVKRAVELFKGYELFQVIGK